MKHVCFILANPSQSLLISNPVLAYLLPVSYIWCRDLDGVADSRPSVAQGLQISRHACLQQDRQIFNQELLDELSTAYLPIAIDQPYQEARNVQTVRRPNCEDLEELEHVILETENVQEEISSKIKEINAFIDLREKSKATTTVSQPRDSGMSETQGKENPQTTRQSLNLDAQAFTTLLSLSSTTNTISVAVSSNGVTAPSPSVFFRRIWIEPLGVVWISSARAHYLHCLPPQVL